MEGNRAMKLYETIFTRCAVRSYDMTAPDSAALSEIQAFILDEYVYKK